MTVLINSRDTYTIIEMLSQRPPVPGWLQARYFPTNTETDVFSTLKVLVDYLDGDRKMAPFVLEGSRESKRIIGITEEYKPPRISVKRDLNVEDTRKRLEGQMLSSAMGQRGFTPEDVALALTLRDYQELVAQITRRVEWMAAQLLTGMEVECAHFIDGVSDDTEVQFLRFYQGSANPQKYTPSANWDDPTADILMDLYIMTSEIRNHGGMPRDIIISPDVAYVMLNDEKFVKLFDLLHVNMGALDPTVGGGEGGDDSDGAFFGKILVYGTPINMYVYHGSYVDAAGKTQFILDPGTVIMASPNCGRTYYGAVTQVEGVADRGQMITHFGKHIPKEVPDYDRDTIERRLTSAPLPCPVRTWEWMSAKVLDSPTPIVINSPKTVTYDANTGTGSAPAAAQVDHGNNHTVSGQGELTKTGNEFAGWNTAADGSGDAYVEGETLKVLDNITLYAQWIVINSPKTVTYDANTGTGSAPAAAQVDHGNNHTVSGQGELTKTGNEFAGWNTAADGSGDTYVEGDILKVLDNITLYAQWSAI